MSPKIETVDEFFDSFFPDFPGGATQKDRIIAELLSKKRSTVSSWRSKGIPPSELAHLESLALQLFHCRNILQLFASKGLDSDLLVDFVRRATALGKP